MNFKSRLAQIAQAAFWVFFCAPVAEAAVSFECQEDLSAEKSESHYEQAKSSISDSTTLSADFVQQTFLPGLGSSDRSAGSVAFSAPGKMIWRYSEPEEQSFISDGKQTWFYQPGLNQVTLGNFSDTFSASLPVSFMLGIGKLEDSVELKKACFAESDVPGERQLLFKFHPRDKQSQWLELYLAFNPTSQMIRAAKTSDVAGNESTISFVKMKRGVFLPPSAFQFEIPDGVDIIDQRKVVPATGKQN